MFRRERQNQVAAATAMSNRSLFVGKLIVALNFFSLFSAESAAPSLDFAGTSFAPGSTVQANVPLSAQEKSLAAQGGNAVPPNAVAVLGTPVNFDSRKSWPVLVICSTSDFKRQNRNDLVQFYRRMGLAEGWVLLAGDGPQHARNDTAAWRGAMTLAAIDALHRSFNRFGKVAGRVRRFLWRRKRSWLRSAFAGQEWLSHQWNSYDGCERRPSERRVRADPARRGFS